MHPIVKVALALERSLAGLREKSVQVDDHRIVYLEGGQGETILLLHGFGGDGDNWTRFSRNLTGRYHVVAADLPGWGASSRLPGASYGVRGQAERVHRFAESLRIKNFHIAGNSMGGAIAALYAANYPDEVMSLGLFDPFGVKEPRESEVTRAIRQGKNPLLAGSMKDYEHLLDLLFVKRPYAPAALIEYFARGAVENLEGNSRIFVELVQQETPLLEVLPQINARTLILWGEEDRVIDVSCSEVFKAHIRNAQIVVLPDTGHVPMIERPRDSAGRYLAFLEETPKSQRAMRLAAAEPA